MPARKKIITLPAENSDAAAFSQLEQPTDPRLVSLLKFAMEDFRKHLVANEDQIISDIERIEEEEDGDDKAAKFKIAIGLTLNLKTQEVETAISYSIKITEKYSHAKPDDDGTQDMFQAPREE